MLQRRKVVTLMALTPEEQEMLGHSARAMGNTVEVSPTSDPEQLSRALEKMFPGAD
jgi:hypothetical protein